MFLIITLKVKQTITYNNQGGSRLPTNRLPTSLLPTVRLHTKIIAYMHFCTQIKILETELLLPTLLLPTGRLSTYIIVYSQSSSQSFTRNEGHLTSKNDGWVGV